MFTYRDKVHGKVRVVYGKCCCPHKRAHPFTARPKRCCFCCFLKWRMGLILIASAVIFFGLISFLISTILFFGSILSGIHLYIEFPAHATVVTVELIICLFLGTLLLVGIFLRNAKIVLAFAWIILVGYVVALGYLLAIILEGIYVIDALVYIYYGKRHIKEGEIKTEEHIQLGTIYWIYMATHIILLLVLTTYVALLTMTYCDKMVMEKYGQPIFIV